jgi:hypothetical protein
VTKASRIPTRSPKKVPTAGGTSSASETDNPGSRPEPAQPSASPGLHIDDLEGVQNQDLTPTLRTVPPPPTDSPERPLAPRCPGL